ncbi:MAG: Na+/H+ antiporter NhaC family protein [bacterium]|jgi:NhaC family Na+:H+ antiporter
MLFSPRQAQLLLLGIVLLIVAGVLLGIEVYLFLGAALLFTAICTRWRGGSWQRIGEAVGRGLSRSRNVVLILALISILIGLWKQNGTLATLIYYGFGFIRPEIYLVMVFVLSSMVSMLLGTAIGTASTIGIVLMGLAESMGMPAGMVAGAVVGGAYVGDRSAPTSGPLHLVATATGTRSGELIPYLFSTLIPAYLLSVGFYYLLGLWVRPEAVDPGTINHFQELLAGHFTVALYLLLPPLLLLSLAVFRVEIIPNLLLTLAATLICSLLGPFSPGDILHSAIWGYIPAADLPFAAVLSGGGFLSFRNILLVIMVAMSLTALLEATGVIHQAMSGVLHRIETVPQLILATSLFSILAAAVACTQTVAIVAPGAVFQSAYRRLEVDNLVLGRTIADTGVAVSGIIPWSIAALSPALVLGVPVLELIPYAAYCWLSPLVTNFFGLLGWVKRSRPLPEMRLQDWEQGTGP